MVRIWLVLLDKIIKNYMNWFFCYSNTSSYKTDIVKFVIFVTLFNKKCDIYSEKINKKKHEVNFFPFFMLVSGLVSMEWEFFILFFFTILDRQLLRTEATTKGFFGMNQGAVPPGGSAPGYSHLHMGRFNYHLQINPYL